MLCRVAIACVGLFVCACATPRAFPGPELPDSEIAVIRGASRAFPWWIERVRLLSINGHEELHEWCQNWYAAQILPGYYEFGVEYQIDGTSLVGLVLELTTDHRPAVLSFEVIAGYRYWMHFDPERDLYSVSRARMSRPALRWEPPPGTEPCFPDPNSASRLLCPIHGATRKGDLGSPAAAHGDGAVD